MAYVSTAKSVSAEGSSPAARVISSPSASGESPAAECERFGSGRERDAEDHNEITIAMRATDRPRVK